MVFAQDIHPDDRKASCQQARIILGNPPVDWIQNSEALEWMQLSSAGFGEYTPLADVDINFTITNSAGLFGTPVAETALAGILALLRYLPTFVLDREQQHWRGAAVRPELGTLTGKSVLVLGSGSIGGTFRKLLTGFECEVATMGNRHGADFYTLEELDQRLPGADVVMAALPETEATRDMFTEQRLRRLSATCIFANVGRGSLVDETALIKQLVSNQLGGAVLDVTRNEPLTNDDPLWSAPRTILTQHSGGGAQDEKLRIVQRFAHNLKLYQAGKPLDYIVDLGRGY